MGTSENVVWYGRKVVLKWIGGTQSLSDLKGNLKIKGCKVEGPPGNFFLKTWEAASKAWCMLQAELNTL